MEELKPVFDARCCGTTHVKVPNPEPFRRSNGRAVSGTAYLSAGYHQCSNKAVVMRDGKFYCRVHDPVAIQERMKARAKRKKEQLQMEPLGTNITSDLHETIEFYRRESIYFRAELAHKDKLIEALRRVVKAHDEYLWISDWAVGWPVSESLETKLQQAYERRDTARAALEAVENASCPK